MPPSGGTTIHRLPDDLLARCLDPLPAKDRWGGGDSWQPPTLVLAPCVPQTAQKENSLG